MADEQQQDEPQEPEYKYDTLPEHIEFGTSARCPRCAGKGREPGTKIDAGIPCGRCNGFGVVPNKGAIGYTR